MRINTKTGDVFFVEIDNNYRKYFQYIANDLTQLNSDVIRAFRNTYPIDAKPDLEDIVNDEIDFYAHCVVKSGLKMNLWEKIGNTKNVGDIKQVLFRDTNDYGAKIDGERIKISQKWYVWRVNDDDFTRVGKLEGENQKSYVGIVINPLGIIELLKGNKYPPNYPDFEWTD